MSVYSNQVDSAPQRGEQNTSPSMSAKAFNTCRGQDLFGESLSMKLEGETHVVQSYGGSCCSLLIMCITVLYAMQKFNVLLEKKDIDVLSTTLDSYYDENFVFSY